MQSSQVPCKNVPETEDSSSENLKHCCSVNPPALKQIASCTETK